MTRTQKQAEIAKKRGYKFIASVVKSVYYTTYYHVNTVDDVICHGWIACNRGQYVSDRTGNTWHGRYGQSQLPNNTIMRTELFKI